MGKGRKKNRSKASSAAAQAPAQELAPAEALKSEGNKLFLAGDFAEAAKRYTEVCAWEPGGAKSPLPSPAEQALEHAPDDHKICSNRCAANVGVATPEVRAPVQPAPFTSLTVAAGMQSLTAALADADRCIELAPDWSKGFFRKGVALRALGRGVEAKAAFAESARLDPSNDEVQQALEEVTRLGLTVTEEGVSPDLEKPKFDALTEWLLEGGARFPDLYLRRYAEGHRGVHTRTNVKASQTIMSIPRKFLITVDMGRATELGRAMEAAELDLTAPKHCFLCAFVLVDRQNPRSFFRPYYDILPAAFPSFPITWSDEQLAPLQGSYCINQIRNKRRNLEDDYEEICRVEPNFRRFATLDDFIWARLMVASRNFSIRVDGNKTDALVPLADMLNHYRPRETRWTFDEGEDAFIISSMRQLRMGNQVFDSYGKKCNSRFLLNYGFAVDDNCDEDGTCHNEVFVVLDLLPDDAQREAKAAMLNGVNSARGVRVSMHHDGPAETREAFSYARFICARGNELMHFPSGDFDDARIPPISCENEVRTLRLLAAHTAEIESGYPTTLEEDLELLGSGTLRPGSNERNCVVMRKCEKEVCRFYRTLAEEAIPLLQSDWATAKRNIYKQYNSGHRNRKPLEDYMKGVVARVVRTSSGK